MVFQLRSAQICTFFPEKVCAVGNGTLPCDWGETDPCAPVDRDTCDKMTPTEQCFP